MQRLMLWELVTCGMRAFSSIWGRRNAPFQRVLCFTSGTVMSRFPETRKIDRNRYFFWGGAGRLITPMRAFLFLFYTSAVLCAHFMFYVGCVVCFD